eukprot:Nk52_evm146s226 gene=Nk52_evmTU146s226
MGNSGGNSESAARKNSTREGSSGGNDEKQQACEQVKDHEQTSGGGEGVVIGAEIEESSLHVPLPRMLHFYVWPYAVLYLLWLSGIIYFRFDDDEVDEFNNLILQSTKLAAKNMTGEEEDYDPYAPENMDIDVNYLLLSLIAMANGITYLSCHWSVKLKTVFTCLPCSDPAKATHVRVQPIANHGAAELVKIEHIVSKVTGQAESYFFFQQTKYIYDHSLGKFVNLSFPADKNIGHYLSSKGYANEAEVEEAIYKYGENSFDIPIPPFFDLLKEQAMAPFFVFQVFSVALWSMEAMFYYSMFTLFMLVMFECLIVKQRLKNMSDLKELGSKPYKLQVYRERKWREKMSNELLPGDIVSLTRHGEDYSCPCDFLLLNGHCIVNEAMLTGESTPQVKEPILDLNPNDNLDMKLHGKLNVVFGGTRVVHLTPPEKDSAGLRAPDKGVTAYVLKTGFDTDQGKLVRTIVFGSERVTANSMEAFIFILFLLVFAVYAAIYVWNKGMEDPDRKKSKLLLKCIIIVTAVIPPELPMELSLAVNHSLIALVEFYIYCTEPFRIPFAGKIDICCFDKTGTLTTDDLLVDGVAGLEPTETDRKSVGSGVRRMNELPVQSYYVLGGCQALSVLDGELVGDPMEKEVLKAINFNIPHADVVVPSGKSALRGQIKVKHRWHFASALKRMAAVIEVEEGNVRKNYGVCKGAPETLEKFFQDVPFNYAATYKAFAREGSRVIALGYKPMAESYSSSELRDMDRSVVEKDLIFAGFLIVNCPLKSDSKKALKLLKNSSHYLVMITGDNALTACRVAQDCLIVDKTPLILTNSSSMAGEFPKTFPEGWFWQTNDENLNMPLLPDNDVKSLNKYDLCVTGKGLTYLAGRHDFLKFLPRIKVYARTSPDQKAFIIGSLNSLGYTTCMCGDGTNDVGALKRAHVGVALLGCTEEEVKEKMKHDLEKRKLEFRKNYEERMLKYEEQRAAYSAGPSTQAVQKTKRQIELEKKVMEMNESLQDMDMQDVPRVQLGDASVASPFTSKVSSVMCIPHLVRYGRCTLVITMQMFRILALNCLISAYSLSELALEGIKFSDFQYTSQGIFLAMCFFHISKAKPLEKLSAVRPVTSIFNFYMPLTVLLQFAVHIYSIRFLIDLTKSISDWDENKVDVDADFEPNVVNSAVFIISSTMQVSTFAVNYAGSPFMPTLMEHKPLFYSVLGSFAAMFIAASGSKPEFNKYMQLELFEPDLSDTILRVLALDFIGAFLVDRVLWFLFANTKPKPLY